MFKKWKTHFWNFFHLCKMKDILSKQFACLRNGKQAFEAFFVFTKWKHVFYLETLFISKKRTLQKHVRSCIGILFCKCKNQFKMCFFFLNNFVSLKTAYKTCFFIFVKTKDASKLLWFFLQKRRTLQKCVFHF